jgi:hypothetical protein
MNETDAFCSISKHRIRKQTTATNDQLDKNKPCFMGHGTKTIGTSAM